ncbi:MAG: SCO family protein [Bdellovibrionales bacterium]|nr:SCO family protein [Bdellovibrionales bacterium]
MKHIVLSILLVMCSASGFAKDANLPEESLYNLGSTWKNQSGEDVALVSLQGEVQIIAMIFTSCQYACPMIIADIKKIIEELPKKKQRQIHVSLFSFDPEKDTPKTLDKFSKKSSLGENWQLYTSHDDNVREIAAVLGVKYKKMTNGMFSHSNIINIVNVKGVVLHQQNGINADSSESVKILKELLR